MATTAARPDIPKAYDPKVVEERIYDLWLRGGYFTPTIDRTKGPFVVIMPPPNVTGELHMGHALTIAIEDLMVRWHRMKGIPTLFLPGTDHAGIATQVVVERILSEEGVTRHQLGREQFVERVWSWVNEYGDRIYEQLRRLGTSCDWTRKRFTLDEGPSKAVRTAFVNLHKKGLIYRGDRINNWCPRCRTALSDLEVKHRQESANLYHIRYLGEDGGQGVSVATTRPETLLGDTAVAVNPEDERYANLLGKNVILPILERAIPVIADSAVATDFGTGALKVTPGHDPADFEIGQRHGLPIVNVMDLDGTMNEDAGAYHGQDRFECREHIVAELERRGLLDTVEPYSHSVGHCDRCNEVVEPIVSKQWYVKMEPLARPARDALADGRIAIIPERFTKVYFNWMDNIRDWCISRQLWWGHRIPVWYCGDCDGIIVEYEDPVRCADCGSQAISQDPDVLDTWFSSALWTHSTLGWPDRTEDLDYFYPTSVMETGYDILFFWVARMVMMGLENMRDIPFHTVYLHGLVLDPEGIKMSKTRGNVLDPIQLIGLYGADALRFALTTGNSPGNDMRLNEGKLEASRNFVNKLWNVARFVITNVQDEDVLKMSYPPRSFRHRHDRWIVSRFSRVTSQVESYMAQYQFGEAQRVVHDFMWDEYCDWYVEMAKIRLRPPDEDEISPVPTLIYVLEGLLRLLHPFLPFITEEIWHTLNGCLPGQPDRADALIAAPYPVPDPALIDDQAEADISAVVEIVRLIRNLRAEFKIQTSQGLEAFVNSPGTGTVVQEEAATVKNLARLERLAVNSGEPPASADQVAFVLTEGTITVPLHGLVDVDRERERLTRELGELDANRSRLSQRLGDAQFLAKAPADVVEKESQRLETADERRGRVVEMLSRLGG